MIKTFTIETGQKLTEEQLAEINEAKKLLSNKKINTEQPQTNIENNTEQGTDDSDITSLSASASTNANLNDTTMTDDKADRKLSRFNIESIIESKKKKKKVQAVLASSTNSKK